MLNNDDLVSEGYFGLLNAIKSYKLEKGPFSGYAAPCIKNSIIQYLKRELRRDTDSLEENIAKNKNGNKDVLAAPVNAEAEVVEKDETDRQMAWIREKLDQLPSTQKKVLIAKYLSGAASLSGGALKKELGCSHQNIQKAEKKAIARLKEMYYESHPEEIAVGKAKKVKKTDEQVAQKVNLTTDNAKANIQTTTEKLSTPCNSIKNQKYLKNIPGFSIEASEKEC